MSINQETSFKVVSSRVPLGLEELGYGPEGSLTRGQWRQLCIDKLSSPEEHSIWLKGFHQLPSSSHFNQKFDVLITFEDWSTETVSRSGPGDCLDFTAADIDLGGIVLNSIFHRTTFFTGSTFQGPADFSNAVFSEPVDLSYTEFVENASFVRCRFEKGVTFVRSRSTGGIAFNGARFSGTPTVTYLGQSSYSQFTDFSV